MACCLPGTVQHRATLVAALTWRSLWTNRGASLLPLLTLQGSGPWDAVDLAELASMAIKALRAHRVAAGHSRIVLAGVGFGGVLAHEMALQLNRLNDSVQALALFDGLHAVRAPALPLGPRSQEQHDEICLVAAALYPLVSHAAGDDASSVDAFSAGLASCAGYDAQLEYVASFRPQEVGVPLQHRSTPPTEPDLLLAGCATWQDHCRAGGPIWLLS